MRIEIWYDIVSPYSYLAYVALDRYRPRWGFELEMKPAFLGGLLQLVESRPPISLTARRPWLLEDIQRTSRFFAAPMTIPEGFPHLTITPMRVLVQLADAQDARQELVAAALWRRYFGQGLDVNDPEVLLAAAVDAGLERREAEALLTKTKDDAVKDLLKRKTEEARAAGLFGFPGIFVHGHPDQKEGEPPYFVFGSDRFERMAFDLGLRWEGPVPGRD